VSAGLYAATRSPELALSSLVAGFVIDGDHLVDYAVEHGARPDAAHFFRTFRDDLFERARLPLHGWEWVALWFIASWLTDWNMWLLGAAVGWLQHLLFDQFVNRAAPGGYWLSYRLLTGFDYAKSFPKKLEH
jgi:hypothetical protein